jgi:hypothetical protein
MQVLVRHAGPSAVAALAVGDMLVVVIDCGDD